MPSRASGTRWLRSSLFLAGLPVAVGLAAGLTGSSPAAPPSQADAVLRGRQLVLQHGCAGCHGGVVSPAQDGWLVGMRGPELEFRIGPCAFQPGAEPCFRTRPRNLTPDNLTGLGRFSARQIFNALRFGLRPGETPDLEITSTTPGEGNHPLDPKYLAPPMPWPAFRHMPDAELWAIAAYLKDGVQAVSHRVDDSEGPPDFWAEAYTVEAIGPHPAAAFPTGNEVRPAAGSTELAKVLKGRELVISHACGDCHGGGGNPAAEGWLAGVRSPQMEFPVGPCIADSTKPCLMQRPRNLTPHQATGTGGYSERQIFNALRYGLRPSETPDLAISSTILGRGNFPATPNYLGQGMPWPYWRYMSDEDLWAVAAYLKHGLKPVANQVKDSDSPADFWASEYTVEKIGTYPAPSFPTAHERRPGG